MKISALCVIIMAIFLFPSNDSEVKAQANTITAGFQYKPVFATKLLITDPPLQTINNVDFSLNQRSGHCFGMVVRRGFSKTLSFETGINFTKRKYRLTIHDSSFTDVSYFSTVSYEIPALLLVYIRLGKVYMNASMGAVLDMFISDLGSSDTSFSQSTLRRNLFKPGLLANIGYEYRTVNSGYFYFGVSYHRPFGSIYSTTVTYHTTEMQTTLSGSYLTIDLRYFFHEDPIKKKTRKDRKKKVKSSLEME